MHECPECGQYCHCCGDFDDCEVFTDEWVISNCRHDCDERYSDDSAYDSDSWDTYFDYAYAEEPQVESVGHWMGKRQRRRDRGRQRQQRDARLERAMIALRAVRAYQARFIGLDAEGLPDA